MGDVSALTELASDLESAGGAPATYAQRISDLAAMFDFPALNALADDVESSASDQE
jgi:hypothetical protein